MTDLITSVIEEHLKLKPIRPNASTCSPAAWAKFNEEFCDWSARMDMLRIDSIKPEIQARVESTRSFGCSILAM